MEEIRARLSADRRHNYLGDAVLGGIDGCVTTFAVVSGASGAGFPGIVVIVLGFANLLADGFSMAVSNYQSTKSQRELTDKARRQEEIEIDSVPDEEREEVREIYRRKGFNGLLLDGVVDVITSDRKLWVDTMLMEELGHRLEGPDPLRAALTTFSAFVAVGLVPLIPFLFAVHDSGAAFLPSVIAAGAAFLCVGMAKGVALGRSVSKSGLETLLTGGAAASLAYFIGKILSETFGIV